MEYPTIKNQSRERILDIFLMLKDKNKQIKTYILVVDRFTVKIISKLFKFNELMEMGVDCIEKLELRRQKYQEKQGIYLITPCEESVDLVIKDFNSQQKYQYDAANIFFTRKVSKKMMERIGTSPDLLSRLEVCQQVNLDFVAIAANVVDLDIVNSVQQLYLSDELENQKVKELICDKVMTVLSTIGNFYEFLIIYNHNELSISKDISEGIREKIESYLQKEGDMKNKESGQITIMVLDRSIDLSSCLMHNFYHEPLCQDLLNIENNIYQDEKKKKHLLTEDDIYLQNKDKFFQDFKSEVDREYKEYQKIMQNSNLEKMEEMRERMKMMPQLKKTEKSIECNFQMIGEINDIIQKKDLIEMTEFQEQIVTGLDQGRKESTTKLKLQTQLGAWLTSTVLSPIDKLRLILLSKLHLQLTDQDINNLTLNIQSEYHSVIANITNLIITSPIQKLRQIDQQQAKTTNGFTRHTPYILNIIPTIYSAIQNNTKNSLTEILNFQSFPINQGVQKKKKTNKINNKKNEDFEEDYKKKDKLIILMNGGLSYSELNQLRMNNLVKDVEVIIVATNFMTQTQFVNQLINKQTELIHLEIQQ